jgi:hypothetical protein
MSPSMDESIDKVLSSNPRTGNKNEEIKRILQGKSLEPFTFEQS